MITSLHRIVFVLFGSALVLSTPSVRAGDPGVLVPGCLSDHPQAHCEPLKPLLDYVVPRIADADAGERLLRFFKTIRLLLLDPPSTRSSNYIGNGVSGVGTDVV